MTGRKSEWYVEVQLDGRSKQPPLLWTRYRETAYQAARAFYELPGVAVGVGKEGEAPQKTWGNFDLEANA